MAACRRTSRSCGRVNVGGRNYKMADLREHLTESGLDEVETHIQTGNVRFRTAMRSPARRSSGTSRRCSASTAGSTCRR